MKILYKFRKIKIFYMTILLFYNNYFVCIFFCTKILEIEKKIYVLLFLNR